jgi:cell division protein ZapA
MVNDRLYKVTCDDGQEPRLRHLAGHIDGHVRKIVGDLGQIGDARLLLLAGLTVADELFESRARLAEADGAGAALDLETVGGATRVVDAATRRVTEMADRLHDA